MEFVGEARQPAMNHPPVDDYKSDDDEEENVDDTEEENREVEWRKNGSMISKSGGTWRQVKIYNYHMAIKKI